METITIKTTAIESEVCKMGLLNRLFGGGDDNSHHNQSGDNNYQDNSVRINYGGDGRECPFNWVISSSTCGICSKLHTCRDGREWKESLLRNMSDY